MRKIEKNSKTAITFLLQRRDTKCSRLRNIATAHNGGQAIQGVTCEASRMLTPSSRDGSSVE